MTPTFVAFMTDFGLADDYVGTCHGVIRRIAPEAQVIDVTHGIRPGRVLQGARVLAHTLPYMPVGIHLAVVDPGVGSDRRAVAVADAEGRVFVGPDNGLLVPAAERAGAIAAVHELVNEEYALRPRSSTFHGRDVFAPAAAHLAAGVGLDALGPALDPATLVRLELPEAELGASRIRASVLDVDRFGNVVLNVAREQIDRCGIGPKLEVVVRGDRYLATTGRTYSDVRRGDILVYEDSWGNVEVAVSGGDAARLLRVDSGDELVLQPESP